MKINPIITTYNNNNHYSNKSINKNPAVTSQIQDIATNEIAAIIGRSQVSFSGINDLKNGVFTHDCTEKNFGKPAVYEHIEYNKYTGEFKHYQTNKKGEMISEYSFNPQTNTERSTQTLSNGNISTKISSPFEEITNEKNKQGEEVYYLRKSKNGYFEERITEPNKSRRIIRKGNNYNCVTEVIDLTTMQPVYSGNLIYDTYKKNNVIYTKNLLTEQIVKEKQFASNGELIYSKQYSEVSKKLIKHTCRTKEGYMDIEYYDDSLNQIKKETFENHNKTLLTTTDYDKFGRVIKEIEYRKNADGKISSVTEFYPEDTSQIKSKKKINGKNETISFYKKYTKFPYKEEYYTNGELNSEIFYDEFTGNINSEKTYEENGDYTIYQYQNGRPVQGNVYNQQGQEFATLRFSAKTGKLEEEINIDLDTGHRTKYRYAADGKTLKDYFKTDYYGNPLEYYSYYPDGEKIKVHREYITNNIYIETTYDEAGNVKTQNKYDNSRKKAGGNYNSNCSRNYTSYTDTVDDETFLTKMNNEIARNGIKNISEYQWGRFAKIVGVEDYTLIKNYDKKTLRNLLKTYHPDVCKDPKGEVITKILNMINK